MKHPNKIIRIALDDYVGALHGVISEETLAAVTAELEKKKILPNLLKDATKHVAYDHHNDRQHVYIVGPSHPILVTNIEESEI